MGFKKKIKDGDTALSRFGGDYLSRAENE